MENTLYFTIVIFSLSFEKKKRFFSSSLSHLLGRSFSGEIERHSPRCCFCGRGGLAICASSLPAAAARRKRVGAREHFEEASKAGEEGKGKGVNNSSEFSSSPSSLFYLGRRETERQEWESRRSKGRPFQKSVASLSPMSHFSTFGRLSLSSKLSSFQKTKALSFLGAF